MLQAFLNGFLYLQNSLGSLVVMPMFLVIIGLVFRMKFFRALRCGLLVVIGFKGINLMIGFFSETIQPAIDGMTAHVGITFDTIDVGFPTIGASMWALPMIVYVVPTIILVNVVMLLFKWTNVLNIDIWNYFTLICPAGMAYVLSGGNMILAIAVTIIFTVFMLKEAEWEAPYWQEAYGLKGTTECIVPNGAANICCFIVNKIIDHIPGLKDAEIDASKTKRLSWLGDPIFLGFTIGAVFSILGGLGFSEILNTAIGLAVVMMLLPRMAALLLEGLAGITAAGSKFMKEKFKDRELLLAMDVACGIGNPVCITVTTICIPLYILIAMFLPGSTWMPLVSLTGVCYFAVNAVQMSKGNLLRSLISLLVFLTLHCYVETLIAPAMTQIATYSGMALPEGATYIAGGNPESFLLLIVRYIAPLFAR